MQRIICYVLVIWLIVYYPCFVSRVEGTTLISFYTVFCYEVAVSLRGPKEEQCCQNVVCLFSWLAIVTHWWTSIPFRLLFGDGCVNCTALLWRLLCAITSSKLTVRKYLERGWPLFKPQCLILFSHVLERQDVTYRREGLGVADLNCAT